MYEIKLLMFNFQKKNKLLKQYYEGLLQTRLNNDYFLLKILNILQGFFDVDYNYTNNYVYELGQFDHEFYIYSLFKKLCKIDIIYCNKYTIYYVDRILTNILLKTHNNNVYKTILTDNIEKLITKYSQIPNGWIHLFMFDLRATYIANVEFRQNILKKTTTILEKTYLNYRNKKILKTIYYYCYLKKYSAFNEDICLKIVSVMNKTKFNITKETKLKSIIYYYGKCSIEELTKKQIAKLIDILIGYKGISYVCDKLTREQLNTLYKKLLEKHNIDYTLLMSL